MRTVLPSTILLPNATQAQRILRDDVFVYLPDNAQIALRKAEEYTGFPYLTPKTHSQSQSAFNRRNPNTCDISLNQEAEL